LAYWILFALDKVDSRFIRLVCYVAMPFQYVLVPCDASEEMQELEYADDIVDLSKDTFREHCEKYFANMGQSVDRSVLLDQLTQRTGVNLKDKAATGELSAQALDNLLQATSCEIFPVMLPTKGTQFEAVSVYCDDKGVAKGLQENARMSGLVQGAGYPSGQTFRGDCFIGKVYDDEEGDEWRRTSFTMKDCSTDATWVKKCKEQRSKRSSGDMKALADKMGVNNAAKIMPDQTAESAPTGETEQYAWKQVSDEVEITFKKEGLMKGEKKLVKVDFKKNHLRVEAKGEVLIDADLYGPTHPDESTWTLSDGVLQVMLAKAGEESWNTLVN